MLGRRIHRGCCPGSRRRRCKCPDGGLELGFRIDKEIRRTNDSFARMQALEDHHLVIDSQSNFQLAGFEIALSVVDKGKLAGARLQDAGAWNDQLPSQRDSNRDIHVHAGLQHEAGITEDEPRPHGARHGINLRKNLVNPPGKAPARICIHGDRRPVAA